MPSGGRPRPAPPIGHQCYVGRMLTSPSQSETYTRPSGPIAMGEPGNTVALLNGKDVNSLSPRSSRWTERVGCQVYPVLTPSLVTNKSPTLLVAT